MSYLGKWFPYEYLLTSVVVVFSLDAKRSAATRSEPSANSTKQDRNILMDLMKWSMLSATKWLSLPRMES